MWISVKDRVPEGDQKVLVACVNENKNPWQPEEHFLDVTAFDGDDFGICADVTHWMPLPEPPKQEQSNG
jgi:hypothetical protein